MPISAEQYIDVPDALKELRQWVIWHLTPNGKVPHSTKTNFEIDVNDPSHWVDFDTAIKRGIKCKADGIGFAARNGVILIDLDDCVTDGEINPIAQALIDRFQSYSEYSPSGTGVRIVIQGDLPDVTKRDFSPSKHGIKGTVFANTLYCTITGRQIPSTPQKIANHNGTLSQWFNETFPNEADDTPKPILDKPTDLTFRLAQQQLAQRLALDSAFKQVWQGTAKYASNSEAVLGLRIDLLRLTLGNVQLADQLFQTSPLYQTNPAKWDRIAQYDYPKALAKLKLDTPNVITPQGGSKYKLMTLAEAFDRPPPKWLKEPYIVANESNVLFASSGTGKTALAVWLAVELALAGHTIVYAAIENAAGVIGRIKAYTEQRGIDVAQLPLRVIEAPLTVNDPANVQEFCAAMMYYTCDLIIFDTLSNIIKGTINKDEVIREAFEGIRAIEKALGCASLTITHSGWSEQDREMGSIALRNNSSLTMGLESVAGEKGKLRLFWTKSRHAQDPKPETFQLKSNSTTMQGESFTGVWAEPTGLRFSFKLSENAQAILALLDEDGLTFGDWLSASGLTRKVFNEAVKELARWKLIQKDGVNRLARWGLTEDGTMWLSS